MSKINPVFLRFFIPVIEVLRELGGSGTRREVIDLVIEKLNISEKEQNETLKNGGSKVRNQVQFAKLYLQYGGYLSSSEKGIWTLTSKGLNSKFTRDDAIELLKEQRKRLRLQNKKKKELESADETNVIEENEDDIEFLDVLKKLPPEGFERLCQRLLRESGFQEVKVTGKSGDGGIDGYGNLEVNPFVSFNVLFQSKRYKGSVSASQVRDFRGAMQGRADKGIMITTGSFTSDAKKEAKRDGVPPIELVDGEKLVEMFQKLELGVKPRIVYEIDEEFFREFIN